MGTDIYLIVKTAQLPKLPVEVRDYIDIDEEHGYSLNEIREMIENFEAHKQDDPEGSQQKAANEFLKACESRWAQEGWDMEVGANFLVSY